MRRVIIEYVPNKMQQGGLTNADLLIGNYAAPSNSPNVEVEQGEFTKNSQTGQVQEVVGKKHVDGGEKINLPDQSKVLSDYTKIGSSNVAIFNEMFDIKVKASDTFATVLDKYNRKIGVKDLEEEEKELLEKLEKNTKSSIDRTTKQINEDFLAQEIAEVNKKKESLNKLKAQAFETIFKEQEKIPKKGDGTEVLNKNGNPIKQQGGMVNEKIIALAKQYKMKPEEVIQILQEGAYKKRQSYQEGGQTEQIAQSIIQQLQSGVSPDEVITQLIQQGVPHEEAMQLVQGIIQQAAPQEEQSQMRYGGMYNEIPYHQEKGVVTPPKDIRAKWWDIPTVVEDPNREGYDYKKAVISENPLTGVEYMQPYTGSGYGSQMQDVEKTINLHDWFFNTPEKKEQFRQAIKKQGEQPIVGEFQKGYNEEVIKRGKAAGLNDEQIKNLVNQYGFSGKGVQQLDSKFGAFTSSRPLFSFDKKALEATPTTQAGVLSETQPVNRDVVKNILYEKGMPYIMPPSAPIAPYLQQVDLSRLEGQKGSVENQLQASENARQALYASTANLPPAQRAAILASSLATSGQQDVQGIAAQEMQDLQNKARIEQYNAGQSDKEQILNEQLKKQYEKEAFATLNVNEQNWRNYYDANQANQKAISDEIERRNIMNLGLDNYQLNGRGGFDFVNRSPFQGQDPQASAYLRWFNTLSPEQQIAERKKQYDLMSKKA